MNEWIARLKARWVADHGGMRDESYREEALRIRRGDALSWTLILTGFAPLALQKMSLAPVWIALVIACLVAKRRGLTVDTEGANRFALAAMIFGMAYGVATGDKLWGFTLFLVFIGAVLAFKSDMTGEVQRLYLVCFVLFLVFSHLTLDYTFLVGLFLVVMSGLLVMLRYHFPEEVRPGRYLAVARLLARPVLTALVVAIPIFIMCPRVPIAVLKIQDPPHVAGFAEEIRFGEMGESLGSDRVFMTVRYAKPAESAPRKWRGIVLDFYSNGKWRRTAGMGDAAGAKTPADYQSSAPPGEPIWLDKQAQLTRGIERLIAAEVILEPNDVRFFFSPQFPLAVETEFGTLRRDAARTIFRLEEPQSKRVRYTVWFGEARPLEPPKLITTRYLRVPRELPARVKDLAMRVTAGARTDRERAERIDKFLAEGEYTYTLSTVPPSGRDPIDYFLFDAKAGHCEYFSSAMTLMLRTLKIPARVVNGFNPGVYDAYAGTWTVLDRNAHSWVEVYLGSAGWVEFDPTTGRGFEPPVPLAARLGLSELWLYKFVAGVLKRIDFEWQRWVVSFSVSMQWSIVSEIYRMLEDMEMFLRLWWMRHRGGTLITVILAIILCLAAASRLSPRFRKAMRRLRALLEALLALLARILARLAAVRRRPPAIGGFYHEMVGLLERANLFKKPSETPLEFLARVSRAGIAGVEPVRAITQAYHQVAYRGRALSPDEVADLDRALMDVRLGLTRRSQVDA